MTLPTPDANKPHHRSCSAGWILLIVLIVGIGLRFGVVHPGRNYLLDFRAYYAAGKALQTGINPYDLKTIHQNIDLPGEQPVFYYPYPPPSLAVVYPFAAIPYPIAQIPWCLFQYALAIGALILLTRALGVALGSPVSVLLAAAFLLSSAVFELFRWGQFDMIVLALLAASFLHMTKGRSTAAGIFIGLAALAKVTPCVYLGIFVIRRDWKGLAAGLATVAILMAASYPLIGPDGFALWFGHLTEKLGQIKHIISPENMSLHGYVYRALIDHESYLGPSTPWLNLGPAAAKTIATALIGGICLLTLGWMLRWRKTLHATECLAAAVPVVLLMAPITWTHHCVQLLLPLSVVVVTVARQARISRLDLAWLVAILLCLTLWPVQRFHLELPPWMQHLFAPTMTYALLLTWLFIILRLVPLKSGLIRAPTVRERVTVAPAISR